MPLSRTDWTADMLDSLPDDGKRYEVIDGELFVTPAPALVHQRAVSELAFILTPYVKSARLDLFSAPIDVKFSERRLVQPDISVLPTMPSGKPAARFTDVKRLLLAVEVLSPSSLRTDRYKKRTLYQDESVPDYWIVDTDSRTIERWSPGATQVEVFSTTLVWQPIQEHPELVIDVAQYFREVFWE